MLEMMLATALSSMVLIAAFGLFTFMRVADDRLSDRFESIAEHSRAHSVLRRAMRSVVVAPEPADIEAELRRRLREQNEGEGGANISVDRLSPEQRDALLGPPRFSLGPLQTDPGREPDPSGPWRLELTLTSSPILSETGAGPVRGAFDKVAAAEGWRLQWTPIEPEGDPTILATDLRDVFWAVLVREGYVDNYNARFQREMPRAVRVVLFTNDGQVTDWMFEPGAVIGEES
jgi:hypothetical protein